MNILQVNSSARSLHNGQGSHSSRLAGELVARLVAAAPSAAVTVRDLAAQPHPALDESALQALFTPEAQRTPEQAQRVALDDQLIAEIQAADVVVIGAPMYNFGVTSQLKHWIDAIARARVTFRYTEQGAEGLLTGKKVYVVLARGGLYRGTPADTQVPYLQSVLGFLGMTDIEFIYAEGLAMGPEAEARALADARGQIDAALA
ncbi:FMN-dependent NADH-azoreductase [Aquabacterium sp. J223]|uniref:FMN-dependent NADH-azoreductase n=1 Tax=Aquabacterium sp. J223 TaxID=2898431 RepID=UPI0021AD81C8|nr:NAD(P)H-dependent oxidoreductase [Aquabacterium sp. J223]UUX96212.1 NAD(P)H-dependent oxidoreductase [Aquabacterium sp. J223]